MKAAILRALIYTYDMLAERWIDTEPFYQDLKEGRHKMAAQRLRALRQEYGNDHRIIVEAEIDMLIGADCEGEA